MRAESTGEEADVRRRVAGVLQRNIPQIAMHGGDAAIEAVDLDRGDVCILLGGACSDCGISPMTIQAIQHRLVQEVPEIERVYSDASFGSTPGRSGESGERDAFPDVPF